MCGIFGAVAHDGGPLRSPEAIRRMGDGLRHRGPDGEGWLESPGALLGSQRLSIVDLSPEADQPFASPDGRVWLVCNGEVYDAPALRRRFASQGYPFRSRHNDVEAILPLYLERGEEAIAALDGMFALAIWDARAGRLLLARDRAGEKPLFYTEHAGEIRFASEIQALLSAGSTRGEICREGLADYLTLGYCTAPRTLFAGIQKLEAGHLLVAESGSVRVRRYWDPVVFATAERDAAPGALAGAFGRAVRRQVAADVPIGVFTSGGLDSSMLVSEVAGHVGAGSVHTYAARFERASYDESDFATRVCRELGTRHHVVSASESELGRALERASGALAEPVADPAVLPTLLLAEAASRDVKVVLSGEGADELFGGYPTYLGHCWAERFGHLPRGARAAVRRLAHALPVTRRKVSLEFLARRFVDEAERETLDRHLAWFGALGPAAGEFDLQGKGMDLAASWTRLEGVDPPVKRVMVFDLLTYLAENLLTKVDRATMLASVEARAPFLDREVMELALRQPLRANVDGLRTKRLLKRAARGRVPRYVLRRRKRGLSVPVSDWINGSLRDEVDALLDPARLGRQELLDPAPVARLLASHRDGRADHGRQLWPLFVLQRWYDRWLGT